MKQIASQSFFAFYVETENRYYLFNTAKISIYQIPELMFLIAGLWDRFKPVEIVQKLSSHFPVEDIKKGVDTALKLGLFSGNGTATHHSDSAQVPHLRELYLQISHDCNLQCRYCYAGGGYFGGPALHMSEETALKAVDFFLDQLPPNGFGYINFDGGEPLLNWPVVEKVADYAAIEAQKKQKRVGFKLGTNGTLLNAHNTEIMNCYRFSVGISIDGRPESHDACRVFTDQQGSYHAIKENIEHYKELIPDCTLQARATITPSNLNVVKEVKHLIDLGFTHVYFEPVSNAPTQLTLSPEQHDHIRKECEVLADFYLQALLEGKNFFLTNFEMCLKRLHLKQKFSYKCEVGRVGTAVTPKGELFPCYKFSNVEEFKMADLNSGEPILPLKNQQPFLDNHVDHRPECKQCWAKYLCGGGCAYLGYSIKNDITGKDEKECDFILHLIKLSMQIYVTVKNKNPGFWDEYFDKSRHNVTLK